LYTPDDQAQKIGKSLEGIYGRYSSLDSTLKLVFAAIFQATVGPSLTADDAPLCWAGNSVASAQAPAIRSRRIARMFSLDSCPLVWPHIDRLPGGYLAALRERRHRYILTNSWNELKSIRFLQKSFVFLRRRDDIVALARDYGIVKRTQPHCSALDLNPLLDRYSRVNRQII
jgi:hypothetical protein